MIDIHCWPYVERFPALCEVYDFDIITSERFPKLQEWTEDMHALPLVKALALPPAQHASFFRQTGTGHIDFDPVE